MDLLMPRRLLIALLALLAVAPAASASNMVDRNAKNVRLKVSRANVALVTYKAKGIQRHVIYWGASGDGPTFFHYDRSGGAVSRKVKDWRKLKNACRPYRGPKLRALVAACTMPDGSNWAIQAWVRIKKNHGGTTGPKELRIAHWRGALAVLVVKSDWSYPQHFNHLYGTLSYHGRPANPGRFTKSGKVTDGRGRNVAFDTLNSNLGSGWHRADMILAHVPHGEFCMTFVWQGHRSGVSRVNRFRASAAGPGVTPDIVNQPFSIVTGRFNQAIDDAANREIRRLSKGALKTNRCRTEPL
jgi:hypothetical protein